MSRNSCILVPLAEKDKRPSKLYDEIFTATKKDRKLTNFLYALSLQGNIKSMFSKSELNNQGEPRFSVFAEKMHIQDILDAEGIIEVESRNIGATDRRGNVIYYDDIMNITQRVIDFNNDNENLKAVIKYSTEGFYIEIQLINAENYNFNNSLNYRLELLSQLKNLLQNAGLNTDLSEQSDRYMNPLNIYFVIDQLQNLSRTSKINPTLANLIVDLFDTDPQIQRLKSQFGDDLPNAIATVTGYNNSVTLTSYQEAQLKRALLSTLGTLKRTLTDSEIEDIKELAKNTTTFENSFNGIDTSNVYETLKDLYETYNINQDVVLDINKRVKKLSEAARKLLFLKISLENESALKKGVGINTRTLVRKQKEVDSGYYIVSICDMLEEIQSSIESCERNLARKKRTLSSNPNSLKVINSISELILEQLDLAEAYLDITASLSRGEHLENDDFTGNDELLDDIKQTAEDIHATLKNIKDAALDAQELVIKNFLTIYWGEKKTLPDGTEVTVDDIMNFGIKDPNLFERFIYSAGTSNDEMLNVIAQAMKQKQDDRDDILKKHFADIRTITKRLYDSGSDSSFMLEFDENGVPKKHVISDYDYDRYERELEAYKEEIKNDPNIPKQSYKELIYKWCQEHTKTIKYKFETEGGRTLELPLSVPIYEKDTKLEDTLTPEQYAYYKKMMDLKAEMLYKIPAANNNTLFETIEVSSTSTQTIIDNGLFRGISIVLGNATKQREDDTDYGEVLSANNLKLTHVNYRGEQIKTLPLFYTHELKDRRRISRDYSRSMCLYLAASQNYIEMDSIANALLLAKDFMLNRRRVQETSGDKRLTEMQRLGKKTYVRAASKLGVSTSLSGLAEDLYDKVLYNRRRKEGKSIYLFGNEYRLDKLSDAILGYTSISGLSLNLLGAEANLLVGKLQMLIDASCGEFFNLKDMAKAELRYFELLPELWLEINSNTKSSKLALLMEKFDVMENFYDAIKETGFYKSPISRIIGNANLFVLYGLGEHLLHAEGMLAVLLNKHNRVLDDNGNEVPLFEAFDVAKDDTGNGRLFIKDGYTNLDGSEITEAQIRKVKGRIAYVNKTMHGAFNPFDKGMLHRYAFGRLVMNFRQWMPAHYQRRFRGLYYDPDLEEYREGYYVSTYRYLKGLVNDLRRAEFHILRNFRNLSKMEQYNVKRAIAETVILAVLSALLWLGGDYKDKKGNWAYRHMIYLLKRLKMETMASNPISLYDFVKNIITILNSPMACLNTIEKLSNLLRITDVAITIEEGRYQGENLYIHNLIYSLPFYRQIMNLLELGESDTLFKIYEK